MGFHDPPFYRIPISPVSALAYLRGRGLRPWAQSVLSAAGAATSPASPAAPLAASRRIRAETSPCASPGGRRAPAILRARPRAPPFARRAGTRAEEAGGGGWRCSGRSPAQRVRERFARPAPPEKKLLLSLLIQPPALKRSVTEVPAVSRFVL